MAHASTHKGIMKIVCMHAFMHINMYACACKSAWEVCHHWCLWKPQEARSIVLYFLSLFYWFLSQEQQKLNWSKLHIMIWGCHNIWELMGFSVWMKCSFEYKFLLGLVTNEKKIENYIAAIFVRLGPVKRWCEWRLFEKISPLEIFFSLEKKVCLLMLWADVRCKHNFLRIFIC